MKRTLFTAALSGLYALVASGRNDLVPAKRAELGSALEGDSIAEDMTPEEIIASGRELMRFDAEMSLAYNGDRPAPTFTRGTETGVPSPGSGTLPDVLQTPVSVPAAVAASDTLTPEQKDAVLAIVDREAKASQDSAYRARVDAYFASNADNPILVRGGDSVRHYLHHSVLSARPAMDSIEEFIAGAIEGVSSLVADERLNARGVNTAEGVTVDEPTKRTGAAVVTREARPWMKEVDKLLAMADDFKSTVGGVIPDKKLREWNREHFIDRLIEDNAIRHGNARSAEEFFNASDAFLAGDGRGMTELVAGSDDMTMSNIYNQPTISTAILIQSFQDMRALQFTGVIGPGIDNGMGGWNPTPGGATDGRVGSVLRIPVETYTAPSGYGAQARNHDEGLMVPEGGAIPMGDTNITWLSFAPAWRRIGAALTTDVIRAAGNGPLNYPAIARAIANISADKQRRIDLALFNEMLWTSDEYAAVAVAAESANLTNNSVYSGAGSIRVNLNPAKTAAAAVVAGTDVSVTYGTGVVAAIRLARGSGGAAAPYTGTSSTALVANPVVKPRTRRDLNAAGTITTSVSNPFTLAGYVQGYLDDNGNIATFAGGGAAATFAVDWENGVVIFNAASGVAGAAGIMTTAVTIGAYTYAVNYDDFAVSTLTLTAGLTVEEQLNSLLGRIDLTAAGMASAPRFNAPNLCLGSAVASTYLTRAPIFAPLFSPPGTGLYPTPDMYAERNGVHFARHNAPWIGADRRLLLTKRGSTKYAIDTPFMLEGPVQMYDQATAAPIAKKAWYAQENSVICTPQVQTQGGTVLNPHSRTVRLL